MSCCTIANGRFSFSKCSLVLCNLIFSILGAILLVASLYVRFSSDWQALFESPTGGFSTLYFLMGLGGVILLISMLGLRGAIKESKFMLCAYVTVIFAALAAQLFVAAVLYEFNTTVSDQMSVKTGISSDTLTGFRGDVLSRIGNATTNIYTQGKCQTTEGSLTTLEIQCNASNTAWFEKFVNTQCTRGRDSWNADELQKCQARDNGKSSAAAVATWCKCTQAISSELHKYAKPLTIVAFAVAGIELLLLLAASYMVCCYDKRKAEAERFDQEQSQGYMAHQQANQPQVGRQGINMV